MTTFIRRRRRPLAIVVAFLTIALSIAVSQAAASAIDVGSGKTGLGPQYNLTSDGNDEAAPFLTNPANFGPGGVVSEPITIIDDIPTITVEYLNGVEVLFDGWASNIQWAPDEVQRVRTWVEAGGVLISTNDDGAADDTDNLRADRLATEFGAPVTGSQTLSNEDALLMVPAGGAGAHDIIVGPFGTVTDVVSGGTVGHFAPAPSGFNVIMRDPSGNAVVIERSVGDGHVILTSDEGFFRRYDDDSPLPSGDNRIFTGNTFAYALALTEAGAPPVSSVTVTTPPGQSTDFRTAVTALQTAASTSSGVITSFGALGLPEGLSISTTGLITGSPTEAGTFGVVITATDSNGTTGQSELFEWTVNETRRCLGELVTIVGEPGVPIVGTLGDDVIWGTHGDDTIRGLAGDDLICARNGDDKVFAGSGADRVNLGKGADLGVGGAGGDTLLGRVGHDTLKGRAGEDTLRGGGGADRILGGAGQDSLFGNAGDDRLNGGANVDACAGGMGADVFFNCE